MPKEIRYLLLSKEELGSALVDYTCAIPVGKKYDSAHGIKLLDSAKGVSVKATMTSFRSVEQDTLEFTTSELLAAIIWLCKKYRIPIARRAHKTLEVIDDQLALIATINLNSASPDVQGNKVVYADTSLKSSRQLL